MTLKTKAEIAAIADVRHQAVSAAVHSGRLAEDVDGFIDLDAESTQSYLQREGSQRRSGKRRRIQTSVRRSSPEPSKLPEALYSRSVVEQCIREAWEKCLEYVSNLTLPVVLGQLADCTLNAKSRTKAMNAIHKLIEQDIIDIGSYVDHAIVFVIDGEKAAANWDAEHYDDDGNPRTARTQQEET